MLKFNIIEVKNSNLSYLKTKTIYIYIYILNNEYVQLVVDFFLDKLEWDAFYMLFHLRLVKGISIVCPIFYMLAKDRKNWKYRR